MITALPTPPQRSDPTNFPARADAFMSALPTFGTEANALQADVNAKQIAAAASASNALTSEGNALTSANNAAASATAAASGSGASAWVSGTTYSVGVVVYSPTNFQSYRRKTAGAGTTDPSLDTTNWSLVSVFIPQKLHVRDEKSSGTGGGASVAGVQQRTLNTVVLNEIPSASLSSNNITLPKGTYDFIIRVPYYAVDQNQAALVNTTDSITYIGSSAYGNNSVGAAGDTWIQGRFTIAASKVFRVDHYTQRGSVTTGLGISVSSSFGTEVYTEAIFTKIS